MLNYWVQVIQKYVLDTLKESSVVMSSMLFDISAQLERALHVDYVLTVYARFLWWFVVCARCPTRLLRRLSK